VERVFSQFGIVHNKLRNRLHPEKVRKAVLVRSEIATHYPVKIARKKRKFATVNDDCDETSDSEAPSTPHHASSAPAPPVTTAIAQSTPPSVEGSPATVQPSAPPSTPPSDVAEPSFTATANELIDEAKEVAAAEEEDVDDEPTPAAAPPRVTAAVANRFLLANLFHYPNSGSTATAFDTLEEFWKQGQTGLTNEVSYHEEIHDTTTISYIPPTDDSSL